MVAYINHYVHDTTFLYFYIHDTLYLTQYVYDTTGVGNLLGDYVSHYLDSLMHDTTYLGENILDSLLRYINDNLPDTVTVTDTLIVYETLTLYDTIYIHDTIYIAEEDIDDVEQTAARIFVREGKIVVETEGEMPVWVYDVTGRRIQPARTPALPGNTVVEVPVSGTYIVKVGDAPARRVVVIR